MKKSFQIWTTLIFSLFLFPIILNFISSELPEEVANVPQFDQKLVYAANLIASEIPTAMEAPIESESQIATNKRALLFATHSQEAFEPVTRKYDGKIAVYHTEANIMRLNETIKAQLEFNDIETKILDVDVAAIMTKKQVPYYKAYDMIRPYVVEELEETDYDIIIDVHRDYLNADRTTLTYEGEKYAKIVFVIGGEHKNFKLNMDLAEKLTAELEEIVPGITRPLVFKAGHGVDGKYNQDLNKRLILVEMGGIENDETELNRTSAVFAKAVSQVLKKDGVCC